MLPSKTPDRPKKRLRKPRPGCPPTPLDGEQDGNQVGFGNYHEDFVQRNQNFDYHGVLARPPSRSSGRDEDLEGAAVNPTFLQLARDESRKRLFNRSLPARGPPVAAPTQSINEHAPRSTFQEARGGIPHTPIGDIEMSHDQPGNPVASALNLPSRHKLNVQVYEAVRRNPLTKNRAKPMSSDEKTVRWTPPPPVTGNDLAARGVPRYRFVNVPVTQSVLDRDRMERLNPACSNDRTESIYVRNMAMAPVYPNPNQDETSAVGGATIKVEVLSSDDEQITEGQETVFQADEGNQSDEMDIDFLMNL